MSKKRNVTRAQVTIFIIAAVVVVAIVLLFLLFRKNIIPSTNGNDETTSPESFLDTCMRAKVSDAIEIIGKNGGYIKPEFYIKYQFANASQPVNISYLCYTEKNYTNCVNQEPMLFEKIESEVREYVGSDVKDCLDSLTNKLNKDGYFVQVKYVDGDYSAEVKRSDVEVKINAEITVTKNNETRTEKDFVIKAPSKIYDIVMLPVQEILRKKAASQSCEFKIPEYMLFYPQFEIDVKTTGDGIEIYTIEHKQTKEIFRFAVRSCVATGGYGL